MHIYRRAFTHVDMRAHIQTDAHAFMHGICAYRHACIQGVLPRHVSYVCVGARVFKRNRAWIDEHRLIGEIINELRKPRARTGEDFERC
jgi:hypothetical protein